MTLTESAESRWYQPIIAFTIVAIMAIATSNANAEVRRDTRPVPLEIPANKDNAMPTDHDRRQIQCLAENAYFEAGNQSQRGMIAVSNVVMNRTRDSRFPSTPCGVIHQRSGRSCQFSWTCHARRAKDRELFQETKRIAEQVYYGNVGDVTNKSLFYHAVYVRPVWSRVFNRTTRIGAHVFYRDT